MLHMKSRLVHLSIDDVVVSMRSMTEDKKRVLPISLFPLLRALHIVFGIKITLYLYRSDENFSIDQIKGIIKDGEWLMFGYHAEASSKRTIELSEEELDMSIKDVHAAINRICIGNHLSPIIRMHYWDYPPYSIPILKQNGYHTLLTRNNQHVVTDMSCWITHCSIEESGFREIKSIIVQFKETQPLVIFTHEWAFKRPSIMLKFIYTILILKIHGYKFI